MEDVCCGGRRAVACVDWSAHHALDRGSFSGFFIFVLYSLASHRQWLPSGSLSVGKLVKRQSKGKAWSRSRLGRAGGGARELLPWTAGPGRPRSTQKLRSRAPSARWRDSKGSSLALVLYLSLYIVCVVCHRTTYFARTRRPSTVLFAHALAVQCYVTEEVRGAESLREVH